MKKTITIKGQEFTLGDVAFNDANVELLEQFMTLFSKPESVTFAAMAQSGVLRNFHRMLKECLTEGNGPDKAAEAMNSLAINFSEDSDMTRALSAVVELFAGGE